MKQSYVLLILLLLITTSSFGQKNTWEEVRSEKFNSTSIIKKQIPKKFKLFSLDKSNFKNQLQEAPYRSSLATRKREVIISIPTPDGKVQRFRIVNSPVFAPELAKKYPNINSYTGWGIDDPTALLKLSISDEKGISGMILSGKHSTIYFDPYTDDLNNYVFYYRKDRSAEGLNDFVCSTEASHQRSHSPSAPTSAQRNTDDQVLRDYRLAVSTTGEYTAYHGGTKAGALAAINTTMTRVNGLYETDFAVTMTLIASTDDVIYTNAGSDPYTNNLNGQLANTLSSVIGLANFDIGHLFHRDANNGNAGCIGCVCSDAGGGEKGSAFTSHTVPEGDPFDIDYVAHEMGHQFGANHTWTFNGSEGTGVQAEPGSGSTIMGYAGITGAATDVQSNSDDYFHYHNINQVSTYIQSQTCHAGNTNTTTLTNATPIANAGSDFTIPEMTAFVLKGSATDADGGDVLTYCWEQTDVNPSVTLPNQNNATGTTNWRSRPPSTSPDRYMPQLSDVIAGNLTNTWETVSNVCRNLNFALIVRDNAAGGGQTHSDLMQVTVDCNSGPFIENYPNGGETWNVGTTETVTWDVANTNAAPINCANVDILLSTDGGNTYPVTLASGVANDGSHDITVPNNPGTNARVMIICSTNIFFDISNANFTIQLIDPDFTISATPDNADVCPPTGESFTIDLTSLLGFNESIALSITGVPSGATANFGTSLVIPTGSSVLTVNPGTAAEGNYNLTVTGTTATKTHSVDITYQILPGSLTTVMLSSPTDGAIDESTSPTLTWTAVTGATSYNLQIAIDAAFSNIVDNQTSLTGTSYIASGLAITTQYYWRVQAINDCTIGNWASEWDFTTQSTTPCSVYTTGPFTDFNPIPSACFNDCTPVTQTFEVYQNESYTFYNMEGGEEYTFDFCNGYNPATWEALITIAEYDAVAASVITGSEFASALGCTLTFTVPTTGDYVIVISDPNDCGAATVTVDNGFPSLTCSGLVSCCGVTFTDPFGSSANYGDDVNETYTLCPDSPDEVIQVTFTEFSLEDNANGDCWDVLSVFDGDNIGAPAIGDFCDAPGGSGSPGVLTSTNANGCLTFQFISDNSVNQAGWVASVDCVCPSPTGCAVTLPLKAFLEGPYAGGQMGDQLRAGNLIPLEEPYTVMTTFTHVNGGGGEMTTTPVLAVTGNDAIVDWVYVELRDAADASIVLATRAGLVQKDGDVVDVDGISDLSFDSVSDGDYFVAIRHRNHLGAMTLNTVAVSSNTMLVDFSDPTTMTYGANALRNIGGTMCMYAGNVDGNLFIRASGPSFINDASQILVRLGVYTNVASATYESYDVNMDGNIRLSGPAFINDGSKLLNTLGSYTSIINQQLP